MARMGQPHDMDCCCEACICRKEEHRVAIEELAETIKNWPRSACCNAWIREPLMGGRICSVCGKPAT